MKMTLEKRLLLSFALTLLILFAEVIGGIISKSLALLSDAGHMLTDVFALGLSMIAVRIGRKPSDRRATFGYQRIGLLAAVFNAVSLIVIALFIFYESYNRFLSPTQIHTTTMLIIAGIGLIGNILIALIIGHGHKDLNIKSAWLHVLGDTLSSVGVIISGIIISYTGWLYADPVASILIGIIILFGGVRVIREALTIFLEMAPTGFDVETIVKKIAEIPGVMGIHNVHLWSPSHGNIAFSAHIWVHDQKLSEVAGLRRTVEEALMAMDIRHIMLQFECAECETNGLYYQIHMEENGNDDSHQH
ncbi:MAG: cation diffusion facilitator family transporter [Thermodesulfovibrionales bacterium]|jgi:cobalt-zinc-cadmium efflux system protein